MKKNYEMINSLYLLVFIFFLFIFFLIFYLFRIKIDCYKVFDSIVVKDDLVLLIVNDRELDMFYSNSFIFIDDHKVKFEINKINSDVLFRNNQSYSELLLNFKFDDKKENDVISFSIFEKKINSYKIFKIIVEEYESIK